MDTITDRALNNGKILKGGKIRELVHYIVNKFSDEGLSRDEAIMVLEYATDAVGEYNKITKMD